MASAGGEAAGRTSPQGDPGLRSPDGAHQQPMRVACLLPSASETLAFIGGEHLIVGRSHECDWPPMQHGGHDDLHASSDPPPSGLMGSWLARAPVLTRALNAFSSSRQMHDAVSAAVGAGAGLYAVDGELLASLAPDVILTQSLCSVCSVDCSIVQRIVATMPHPRPAIHTLNPASIQDVIQDCVAVGNAVGLPELGRAAAAGLTLRLERALALAASLGAPSPGGRVAFLEWTDPLFPGGHWTPQLICMAGGSHPLNPPLQAGGAAAPSTEMPVQAVVDCDPDWVILCPCGLDLDAAEAEAAGIATAPWWKGLRAVREGRVAVVDGNQMFNRPGPRLLDALEWLVALLHGRPDLIPAGFPWRPWDQPSQERAQAAKAAAAAAAAAGAAAAAAATDDALQQRRMPCTPGLPADIEQAHEAACCSGKSHYLDPATGYMVFTEDALVSRGNCCGNRCRHCPFGHCRVTRGPGRVNTPSRPLLLDSKALERSAARVSRQVISGGGGTDGAPAAVGQEAGKGCTAVTTVVLVPWQDGSGGEGSGGLPSKEVLQRMERDGKVPVLLAAFHRDADAGAAGPSACPLLHWSGVYSATSSGNGRPLDPLSREPPMVAGAPEPANATAAARPTCAPCQADATPVVSLSHALDRCLAAGLPLVAVPVAHGEVCFGRVPAPRAASPVPPQGGGAGHAGPDPGAGGASLRLQRAVVAAAADAVCSAASCMHEQQSARGAPNGTHAGSNVRVQMWRPPGADGDVWAEAARSCGVDLL